jgi:HD-GYP domain-containing protein (c-di-GMP phosphodiesterase class II)/DNA-binding CsgD family transcriptional regulator
MAAVWADDIEVRRLMDPVDKADPEDLLIVAETLTRADPERGGAAAVHLLSPAGVEVADQMCLAHRDVGRRFAERLGLGPAVGDGLGVVYERWDGKGMPGPLVGEEIPLAGRVVHVAYIAEAMLREGGVPLAVEIVRRRSGGHFDPVIAEVFVAGAGEMLSTIAGGSVWDRVLDAEPAPHRWLPADRIDGVLEAFADFVDLKSPYMLGHSSGVARLAAGGAGVAGLSAADVLLARRAGLVHDLGRVSVPNTIWDKPAPLTTAEWERVRLHTYYSERVLTSTPLLAEFGRLAGLHHERLDGSGYHRGATPAALPPVARLLAAADVYQALTEPRPHRPALDPEVARTVLGDEARAGRLDAEAVDAVLVCAGLPPSGGRRSWPAGLTDREVEVLRLLARGRSTKAIASELYISLRTANHHVEHIYAKVGVASRAGAALFAMENDLLSS